MLCLLDFTPYLCQMPKFLLLETATEICSVGLWENNTSLVELQAANPYEHTSTLTPLIQQALAKVGWSIDQLDAVAISAGPGSYTALRVGAATAKGICFAGGLPLIAIDTLESLAGAMKAQNGHQEPGLYLPVIDARRMEVYGAIYDQDLNMLEESAAFIVTADKLKAAQGDGPLYLGGNGAEKCRELLISSQKIVVVQCAARHLGPLAERAFAQQNFADLAYFSPNYLKPPNITTPKPVWR